MAKADDDVAAIDKQFQRGLITEDERYEQVVELWQRVTKDVSDEMMASLGDENPVRMMTDSGARGNKGNIGQLGAMRGLMADPSGRIIDVPVRSNFREGMTVLEYFISTHGARKGLADTALRTADSGLPDPAPRGRGAGRHHPRGRLRHAARAAGSSARESRGRARGVPAPPGRPARRRRPRGSRREGQEGRGGPDRRRPQRA